MWRNLKAEVAKQEERFNRFAVSHITTKVLMLYRSPDCHDEVWRYRRTEDTLIFLEARLREWGRKWERVRERTEGDFRREGGTTKVRERQREEEAWRSRRQWNLLSSFSQRLTIGCFTFTHILHIHKHLHACWGKRLFKLCAETWNWSCMLQSILISSLCQRLDRLSLSAVKHKARDEVRTGS